MSKRTGEREVADASQMRVQLQNEGVVDHKIRPGTQVWLYLDRFIEGYAKKLGHLWHGPFRVLELVVDHARLKTRGTEYWLFPIVHVSKVKRARKFPDQPDNKLAVDQEDRVSFDECLLPYDSWVQELEKGEYEVKEILRSRAGKETRYGRQQREFIVR